MSKPTVRRSVVLAVCMSLVATGSGQIYCGRVVRGLVLFCATLLFAPLVVVLALLPPSTMILVFLLAGAAAVVGVYLYAAIAAGVLAARQREYELRDYNHGAVYFVLALVSVIYPVGSAAYLRAHVFEAFYIPSGSMTPTILNGDRVLVNKLARPAQAPERGDLVVFRVPSEPGNNWIKRVIGLPGDRIAVRAGEVFVNGKKLERDPVPAAHLLTLGDQAKGKVFAETNAGRRYLIQLGAGEEKHADFAEKNVPEGSYFVLGDNRDNSKDSREFGFVGRGEMIGAVQYIYWPAESWGRFGAVRE